MRYRIRIVNLAIVLVLKLAEIRYACIHVVNDYGQSSASVIEFGCTVYTQILSRLVKIVHFV